MYMPPAVQMEGVSFRYPARDDRAVPTPAVSDVSHEVADGEFVAVMGSNGCGKSTLAKLACGLLVPQQGIVRVCGHRTDDQENRWEILRRVGIVFQNPDNQFVAETVEEDVVFGLENHGVDPKEMDQRIDGVLQQVGLERYRTARIDQLSGGQKQRLAIACTLAVQPSLLILDEVTSMLDPQGRHEVLNLISQLNTAQGVSILMITHRMEEVLLADRLLVMEAGQVVLQGRPEEVLAQEERLQAAGVELPLASLLAQRLRQRGLPLPPGLYHRRGLVEELWKLLSTN